MSDATLRIFVRTVKRRMEAGEELEEILDSYSKLSEEDKEQIRQAVRD